MIRSGYPKVLAITKRTAQLCGTQSQLHMAGFELVTATSMAIAEVVLKSVAVRGVIICKNSWSETERESFAAGIAKMHPGMILIMRCLGCSGCDEAAGRAGIMNDSAPLMQLILALDPAQN